MVKAFLNLSDYAQQKRRSARKLWVTVLIAAALTLLLAACGYAVYRATMAHREPQPDDAMVYFYNGPVGSESPEKHMELNHGTCALALHFDTEEMGNAYAFQVSESAEIDPSWQAGGENFAAFLRGFSPDWPSPYPADQLRSMEQALKDAGLSEAEAEEWYFRQSFYKGKGKDAMQLQIELLNGPCLHGLDLIYGWPKGEATIVKEGTFEEYQLLEVQIDTDFGDYHEVVNYVFLFQREEQYLLVLAARPDSLDFDQLEQIAQEIEIKKTDFRYRSDHSDMNWSVAGFAAG